MKLSNYTGGFVQTNGYLVETADGNIVIDAPEGISSWCTGRGVRVDHLLLTHQHYDHVTDVAALQALGVVVHALEDYSPELTLESVARNWGLPISVIPYRIDRHLRIEEPLEVAGLKFLLSHIPGHATDSVAFYLRSEAMVFSGDTLFAGSIGRTDLPGGNHEQLLDGIARHLMVLPAATRVLSGHGPETTVGEELASNPYLR